jgi:rhodanese-related sulfurtransferase
MVSKGKIIIATVFLFAIEIANVAVFADEPATSQNNRKPSRRIIQVKSEQLKKDLDSGKNFVLIDVRGPDEYKIGHLPKSINIPQRQLKSKIVKLYPNKNTDLVLYCRTDYRSADCVDALKKIGYTNVKKLLGGFKGWGEAGYSIYNRHGEFKMISFEKKE